MRYGRTAGSTSAGFTTPCFGLVTCTIAALMGAVPGYSQEAAKVALPDTTKCPDVIAEVATCYTAKHASGAFLLAALPKNWNGNLVVFAHGGPDVAPPTAIRSQADLTKYSYAVKLGYGKLDGLPVVLWMLGIGSDPHGSPTYFRTVEASYQNPRVLEALDPYCTRCLA